MKTFWFIPFFITFTYFLTFSRAMASPWPRVIDLIQPTPWQQVQQLQERYHCSLSQPNQEKRVNLAIELHALEECLNQTENFPTPEELQLIKQIKHFVTDQQQIQNRVNLLDEQQRTLTHQQFSTTLQLEGEVILGLLAVEGETRVDDSNLPIKSNLSTGYRARLNFITSFSGKDRFRVRLQARDITELENITGTQMANLGFDGVSGESSEISRLEYEFPLTPSLYTRFQIVGGGLGDFVPTVNPLFSSSGDGAISTFGRENPIRRLGGAPGMGLAYEITDKINLSGGIVVPDADDPETGLFEDRYGGITQLTLFPSDQVTLGLTYVLSFNSVGTGTGSELGEDPFDNESDAIITNALGAEIAWQALPQTTLSARLGYLSAIAEDLEDQPTAESLTWAISLGVTDFGIEGSVTGLILGTPPQVISNRFDHEATDPNATLHLEIFYQWPLNDHLALTPGLIMVLNPEHNRKNPTLYIGTIRATFTF